MTRDSAVILAAQGGPWAQIRTGVVVDAAGSSVVILVGAAMFTASVVLPFGVTDPSAATPAPGTLVAVGRQDASWIVFGSILGSSANLVTDGSFEQSGAGEAPAAWTLYDDEGVSSATVTATPSAVVGSKVVAIDGLSLPVNCRSILYSEAIEVAQGDRIQLSVFAGGDYGDITHSADAALLALWFNTSTALYPAVASPDTEVATVTNVPQQPPWTPLSGTVTAPLNGFLRVGLRSYLYEPGHTVMFDYATARRFD